MLYNQIQEAVNYIRSKTKLQVQYGIVLGTGLSGLAEEIEIEQRIPYKDIPNFPVSTVRSHKGELIFGQFAGVPVVAMAGRFHYYEGYSMKEVTFPIRVMKFLGIKQLFISNAAGGIHAHMEAGDIVFVKDHINLQPENPLRGVNDERLGPRFPDMKETYDMNLITKALQVAKENNIPAHSGVYVGLQGPNLETPAEYNFLNKIGGDLVGMSTVPEVIVARHSDLAVFVLSVVTNKCYPIETIKYTTIDSVIATAKSAEPRMSLIVKELIKYLSGSKSK